MTRDREDPAGDERHGDRLPAGDARGHRPPPGEDPAIVSPDEEDELIAFLERDQLVSDTSRPLPRASMGPAARVALWSLRVFVTVVGAMVVYTFFSQLS